MAKHVYLFIIIRTDTKCVKVTSRTVVGNRVVVVSRSLLFQENHVDTCEFLRFNTLRLNTCTPPISSSYIVLAIKCFPIHHDKHATNFNLCTLV